MDLNFTSEELAFRDEVRAFLRDELPSDIAQRIKSGLSIRAEDYTRWQKILYGRGWGAPTWPKQFGGTGWSPCSCISSTRNRLLPARRARFRSA